MKTLQFLALSLVLFALPGYSAVRYVKSGGSGTSNGSSWVNASGSISTMINNSSSGDSIFVAAGTYSGSITLKSGVHLFGGFPSANNSATFASRTLPGSGANLTILDGNNSVRVVNQANAFSATTVVDGFVIRNGVVNTAPTGTDMKVCSGGGVLLRANGVLRNCEVVSCTSLCYGGGVYLDSASSMISCYVHGNRGGSGSGVGGYKYSTMTNNTITENQSSRAKGASVRYAIGDAYPSYADPAGVEGIVCWVEPGSNGQRGWIIALANVSNGYSTQVNSPTQTNYSTSLPDAFADTAGASNTRKQRLVDVSSTAKTMAVWVVDIDNGWYIPAFGQMYQIFAERAGLNTALAKYPNTNPISNTDTYHTSTQISSTENMKIQMTDGNRANNGKKNSSFNIRYFKTFNVAN